VIRDAFEVSRLYHKESIENEYQRRKDVEAEKERKI